MRILILGISGMLGHMILKVLSQNHEHNLFATYSKNFNSKKLSIENCNFYSFDAYNPESLIPLLDSSRPDVVINCIGIIKQSNDGNNLTSLLQINSIFPRKLSMLCEAYDARLIHFSTDCVFSGFKGMYKENDMPDAEDNYGISKYLGEPSAMNSVCVRTSIIGHGLNGNSSLIDWFLSQEFDVPGYKNAIFSGLPTYEIGKIVSDYLLTNEICGLIHIGGDSISKFDLLTLVAREYEKEISIIENNTVKINRSLDSSKFRSCTNYKPDSWPNLIKNMRISAATVHSS
jgi:dTDP-4-dehydrorhamnose reductase